MSARAERREPFFFGETRRLYGCLHPAAGASTRRTAVLICPPVGQELIRAHRALLQLAVRLARSGFAVLRFDWSGTGDSAGDLADHGPRDWLDDVAVAAAELLRRARPQALAVAGMRLGATFGALGADGLRREGATPAALLLWDPVVRGGEWVEGLAAAHRAMLRHAYVDPDRAAPDGETLERLGFVYPAATFEALGGIELGALDGPPARSTLVLADPADAAAAALADAWRGSGGGADVRLERPEGPRVWSEEPYKGLVPQQALDAAVRYLAEVCP